jgi:hypothetical protein
MVQTRAIRRRCDFIATRLCEIVRRAPEEGFGIYDPVYVVIRQAFIEGITHYGTFEEVEWSVSMLYFQFIEWEFMQPPFAVAVPWQQELMPYEN